MTWTSIHEELFKKINQEMDDYQGRVQSLPGHAVYNRAEEIAAMGFCYNQLMSGFHDHRAEELAPLLELEKPLETLSLRCPISLGFSGAARSRVGYASSI